jgi:hypothetical protein
MPVELSDSIILAGVIFLVDGPIGFFLMRSGKFLLSFFIEGGITLLEILGHKFVVIHDLSIVFLLMGVVFFEYFVHVFRVETKVVAHSVDPILIHFVETCLDDVPDFEVEDGNILVEVHLNDVGDQQKRELYFFGFCILLELWGDVAGIRDVLVEAGVCDAPLHFLQGRSQK